MACVVSGAYFLSLSFFLSERRIMNAMKPITQAITATCGHGKNPRLSFGSDLLDIHPSARRNRRPNTNAQR